MLRIFLALMMFTVVYPYQLAHRGSGELGPASWSPNGDKIAYIYNPQYQEEIFVMDADGRSVVRLTRNPGSDMEPAWSPDGTKITYVGAQGGPYGEHNGIFVMNSDGTNRATLVEETGDYSAPTWSPDGARIAFGRNGQIWAMDADGANKTPLATGPDEYNHDFAWSPDGSHIVFRRDEQVWVMDADGANQTQLAGGGAYLPAWSPDGSRIAFSRNGYIWSMDVDGTNQIQLTSIANTGNGFGLCWSPGGRRIAYVHENAIWAMNADGSDAAMLAVGPQGITSVESPAWSPDGKRIAFRASNGEISRSDIYAIDSSSGDWVNLTKSPGMYGDPAWSPDGSKILFASDRESKSELRITDPYGKDQENIAFDSIWSGSGLSGSPPDWSPDGSRIVLSASTMTNSSNADIYVVNQDLGGVANLTDSDEWFENDPVWSPDGSRIAYGRNGVIWIMDANGDNQTQLTNEEVLNRCPSWSPDGGHIAYLQQAPGTGRLLWPAIWIMDADGSGQRPLTGREHHLLSGGMPANFDWSPDGRQIVYSTSSCGDDPPSPRPVICLINVDGTGSASLVYGSSDNLAPKWSPDGTRIAYRAYSYDNDDLTGIWVLDLSGGEHYRVFDATGVPTWSPDGTKLLASNHDGIWVIDADQPLP